MALSFRCKTLPYHTGKRIMIYIPAHPRIHLLNHFFLSTEKGTSETLDLSNKWSTVIVKELMERAGGASWAEWKVSARAAGLPLVPGEQSEKLKGKAPPKVVLKPKLAEVFKGLPDYSGPAGAKKGDKETVNVEEKSGVAAALP
jgi:hypothetical protein